MALYKHIIYLPAMQFKNFLPDSVAPLWVLPGVVASCSSCGSSPMEKEVLLGSPRPEVSSPSLSAEMANFGSKLGRGP